MKKTLILLFCCIILLIWGCAAWGAIHAQPRQTVDTWYFIEPEPVYIQASFAKYDINGDTYTLSSNYRFNDQTFASVGYGDYDIVTSSMINGSYLFDFGLFVGVHYSQFEDPIMDVTYQKLSPGYRWNLDKEDSYVAFSIDYSETKFNLSEPDFMIEGYDFDLVYYTDKLKILGEVYVADSRDTIGYVTLAYKTAERLVVGGTIESDGDDSYGEVGLTYTADRYIIDAELGKEIEDEFYIDTGFMYRVVDGFYLGAGVAKEPSQDYDLSFKSRYTGKNSTFLLRIDFENDHSYNTSLDLTYQYIF